MAFLAAAWWLLDLSERAFEGARVVSELVLPWVFDGRISAVIPQPDGSWKVRTSLPIADSAGHRVAIFFIDKLPVLKGFVSFPLLWALLIVSHRPWWRRLASGTLLLTGVVILQIMAIAWLRLVVMQTGEPSFVMESMLPPEFRISGGPVPRWEWALSNYVYYVGSLFTPLVAPVVIWAALSRHALLCLLEVVRARSGVVPPRR